MQNGREGEPLTPIGSIRVLFEDADVLAVEKPEGLAAIPGGGAKGMPSLMRLLEDLRQNKFYIVHRLDKEVSGVILFAKNAPAHRHLNGQFAGRAVRKTYIALVHGSMGEGIIDRPLREFGSGRVGVDSKRGKPCLTEFKAIRRFTDYTLVEVHPLTGRRHQIRAHFYSEGHPIVGDPLYGNREIQRRYPRLMLHARAIAFELPSGRAVTIESPLPESFHRILEGLGAEDPGSASRRTG